MKWEKITTDSSAIQVGDYVLARIGKISIFGAVIRINGDVVHVHNGKIIINVNKSYITQIRRP
jgi:hypothetical protein